MAGNDVKDDQLTPDSKKARVRRIVKFGLLAVLLAELAWFAWFGIYAIMQPGTSSGTPKADSRTAQTTSRTPKQAAAKPNKPEAKPLPGLLYNFPDGGRTLFPDYRLIALYGTPNYPVLGALGQQNLQASITRAKKLAKTYQPLMKEHALPAFEIIATVASASPTENGDYSRETDASSLKPWVEAAKKAGVYVVLDLQPGRSDFLKQAREYESLLKEPNVGLALDPEWRLKPNEVPLVQIGTVDTMEINQTADWLAKLADKYKSPQKLFLLHQFRLDMISNRAKLDTSHKELAYTIQMDGQGTQPQKDDTWRGITANPPKNIRFGWKNFYQKDSPVLSPKGTMALKPKPWYVSYQ